MIHRRTFITGMAGLLAAAKAPAIILPNGPAGRILMPVRPLGSGIPFCFPHCYAVTPQDLMNITLSVEMRRGRIEYRSLGSVPCDRFGYVLGFEDFRDGRVKLIYGQPEDQPALRARLQAITYDRVLPYFKDNHALHR